MKSKILEYSLSLLDEEQKVILFEKFNGGTFDDESYNEWVEDLE